MYINNFIVLTCIFLCANSIHETDVNFRVDAGKQMCFYETGKAGQMMEFYYQVLDGQHGDLDISVDIIDPRGIKIVSDHKQTQNSIIMDLEYDGDYTFCIDNTYSLVNSKLVYVFMIVEDKDRDIDEDVEVSTLEGDEEHKEEEILEWVGNYPNGESYAIEVKTITESLMRTLESVVRARHMLDKYKATKSRDSYMASEDTFIVDMWSSFQISLMLLVGMLQVYTIKKLFNTPTSKYCL